MKRVDARAWGGVGFAIAGLIACSSGSSGTSVDAGAGAEADVDGGGGSDAPSSADARVDAANGVDGDAAATDAAEDAPTPCVPKPVVIAVVQTAGGQCSFPFTDSFDAGEINLLLTPGWGTVCFAGSSGNCGSGSSADGWWMSGPGEVSVCDATCTRFYNQTIAGKLTMKLGCPTENCMH
jgi:hypothetical protein